MSVPTTNEGQIDTGLLEAWEIINTVFLFVKLKRTVVHPIYVYTEVHNI